MRLVGSAICYQMQSSQSNMVFVTCRRHSKRPWVLVHFMSQCARNMTRSLGWDTHADIMSSRHRRSEAAIGAAAVADEVGIRVTVIGTPAEEVCDAGGKILLLERGAFEGIHTAMMIHPWSQEIVDPPLIPVSVFEARYKGKAAHFAAFPELGINAADALTVAQVAIGLLRLHIKSTDRVHGIITHGGDAPNIVPDNTSAKYMVRAKNLAELRGD